MRPVLLQLRDALLLLRVRGAERGDGGGEGGYGGFEGAAGFLGGGEFGAELGQGGG